MPGPPLHRGAGPNCEEARLDGGGGGVKPGISFGPSDAFGYKPADRKHPTEVYDIHATILHLLGIDHTKLTVRNNGIDRRLTDVHGHVINELLA